MNTMTRLAPLSKQQLFKSNSTSSIWCHSSISDPSLTELIGSVSTMLHCQMMRDIDSADRARRTLTFFNEETYTGRPVHESPNVRAVSLFLKNVFDVGQFHAECCVISLVYINRLIGVTTVPLTCSNYKPIVITALVLAQKVWDDTPLINADFSILYPVLTVKDINNLELQFLDLLEFKLAVSPSLYAQYYFELRSIYEENQTIVQSEAQNQRITDPRIAQMRGLTKYVLKRVETRSHLSEEYQKEKANYKRQSTTLEDIHYRHHKPIIS